MNDLTKKLGDQITFSMIRDGASRYTALHFGSHLAGEFAQKIQHEIQGLPALVLSVKANEYEFCVNFKLDLGQDVLGDDAGPDFRVTGDRKSVKFQRVK